MEAPAELLAAVPALATALALLLAWLLLRRGAASKREPGRPEKAVAPAPAEEQDTQASKVRPTRPPYTPNPAPRTPRHARSSS